MNNKKIILLFVIGLIALAAVIMIFIRINFESDEEIISKKRLEYTRQRMATMERIMKGDISTKYQSNVINDAYINLDYDERDNADERIDYILNLINTRDTKTLYDNLSEIYRQARFVTLDDFNKFFDEMFINSGDKYVSSGFELDTYSMYITINSADGKFVTEVQTVSSLSDATKNLDISFGRIQTVEKAAFALSTDSIRIDGRNFIVYNQTTSAVLSILNRSEKEVTIKFGNSRMVRNLYNGNKEFSKSIKGNEIIIPPKERVIYELRFQYMYPIPSYIEFNFDINGQNVQKTAYVTQSLNYD